MEDKKNQRKKKKNQAIPPNMIQESNKSKNGRGKAMRIQAIEISLQTRAVQITKRDNDARDATVLLAIMKQR